MEKLPPTSYLKMVDKWLLFGLGIIFLEVILQTIKENLKEETDESVDDEQR